jgi:hypothetical protein
MIPIPRLASQASNTIRAMANGAAATRCGKTRYRKTVMDHAGAVPGAAILSFSSVQVLRTSAVISEQSSI